MPLRVGVIADTHCPEFLEKLPESVFAALRGVDLLLHAGDVGGPETLEALAAIAPLHAVAGDHDRDLRLPPVAELELEGKRVVVVHGNRSRLYEEPLTFLGTVSLGHLWLAPGLLTWLRRRFPQADVIVYGHTHAARVAEVEGALLFNPGAVYQVDRAAAEARLRARPGWFEWTWLQFMSRRRTTLRPSVGILTFEAGRVEATVVAV